MKKEIKDREKQNEFLALLERCIQAYEQADEIFEEVEKVAKSVPDELSAIDSERSDYLHILENYELTPDARACLVQKLEDVCNRRRNVLNISILVGTWNNNKNKVTNSNNRVFLRQAIKNRLSNLDCDYKFRVLSEDDVTNIIEPSMQIPAPKKRGRKPGTKNMSAEIRKKVIEDLLQGEDVSEISSKYSVSLTSVENIKENYIGQHE